MHAVVLHTFFIMFIVHKNISHMLHSSPPPLSHCTVPIPSRNHHQHPTTTLGDETRSRPCTSGTVCLYICMFVYMYVCIYVCLYICMLVCMYARMCENGVSPHVVSPYHLTTPSAPSNHPHIPHITFFITLKSPSPPSPSPPSPSPPSLTTLTLTTLTLTTLPHHTHPQTTLTQLLPEAAVHLSHAAWRDPGAPQLRALSLWAPLPLLSALSLISNSPGANLTVRQYALRSMRSVAPEQVGGEVGRRWGGYGGWGMQMGGWVGVCVKELHVDICMKRRIFV